MQIVRRIEILVKIEFMLGRTEDEDSFQESE
jgi:hypothetical protein